MHENKSKTESVKPSQKIVTVTDHAKLPWLFDVDRDRFFVAGWQMTRPP
jgi:hypothetical protein